MYTRQYKTKKASANSSDTTTTNQFAPRRFVAQPTEEITNNQTPDLQTQLNKEKQSDNNLRNIPLFPRNATQTQPPRIQMKLTIGQPDDKYEQEANRLAADVVQRINAPESEKIQRQELLEDEDKLQMKPIVQRLSVAGGMAATPELEESIQQARSSGQRLTESVREPMEQAFGADFSGVKVHNDAQSDKLNQSIQAKAFTTGQDIFFRQGAYQPESRGGQELLAHELTHVVQQNGDAVKRSPLLPQQLPQQTTSESSSAKAKEKISKQMKQTAMLPIEPTLQRKISYKKGKYKDREQLKSALVTAFGTAAEEKINKMITEVESWKESVFSTDAFKRINDAMIEQGYKPNYAVSKEENTGKHGPKLPDRPDRYTLESKPDAAMSAFNFSSVTLGRITIWYLGKEISFHDRNADENVHAEDGLIEQVREYIKTNHIDPSKCKVNLTINNFFCGPETTKKGKGCTNCLKLIIKLQSTYQFPDFHVYFKNTYGDTEYMEKYVKNLQEEGIKVSSFTTSKDKPPYTSKILDPESESEEEESDKKRKKLDPESESKEEESDKKRKKKQKSNVMDIEPPIGWDGKSLPHEAFKAFIKNSIRKFNIGGMRLTITEYSEEKGIRFSIRPIGG